MVIDPKVRLKKFIKDARKSGGWSQEEFAVLLGTAQANISQWESGQRQPQAIHLFKIADICNKEIILGDRPELLSKLLKNHEKDR